MSDDAPSSYSGRGILRNGLSDRVLGEALSGQVARSLRVRPTLAQNSGGSLALGLERSDPSLNELLADAARAQVVPDEGVPAAAFRQQLGPPSRKPLVVDDPHAGQPLNRFVAGRRSDPGALQAFTQLAR